VFDYILKICLVGNWSLLKLLEENLITKSNFREDNLLTIGVCFTAKDMNINDKQIKTQLWFVDSNVKFAEVKNIILQNPDGYILTFDINNDETLQTCVKDIQFLQTLVKDIQISAEESYRCPVYILGIETNDFELLEKPEEKNVEVDFNENKIELRRLSDQDISDIVYNIKTKYIEFDLKYFKIEKDTTWSLIDVLNELVKNIIRLKG